jgi:hypothetical protein
MMHQMILKYALFSTIQMIYVCYGKLKRNFGKGKGDSYKSGINVYCLSYLYNFVELYPPSSTANATANLENSSM